MEKTIKSCDLESVYNYMDTNYGYKIGSDYKWIVYWKTQVCFLEKNMKTTHYMSTMLEKMVCKVNHY